MGLCEQLRVVRRERLRQLLLKSPAEVPQHPRLGLVSYGELVRIGEATGKLEEHKGLIGTQLKVNGLLRLMAHLEESPTRNQPLATGNSWPDCERHTR